MTSVRQHKHVLVKCLKKDFTWSHAEAEDVREDTGHAEVLHPEYVVLSVCGQKIIFKL